jgi:hypothetical protein
MATIGNGYALCKPLQGRHSEEVNLKPYWGNPTVRNFKEGGGNTGHSEDAVRLCSTWREGESKG